MNKETEELLQGFITDQPQDAAADLLAVMLPDANSVLDLMQIHFEYASQQPAFKNWNLNEKLQFTFRCAFADGAAAMFETMQQLLKDAAAGKE